MRSLAQLKMVHNLLCKRMRLYTLNLVVYNSSWYVSPRNHHPATKFPSFNSTANTYRLASTCPHLPENKEQLLEENKVIRKGDIINLYDLLFTKYRDYVIRHKDHVDVQITDKFEKLSLFDDSGEASSSNSNVVSRLTPHSLSTSRIKPMHYHYHYPRSVIGSHMSKM
ncbi:hypothetical protein AG4045_023437 [Apium graveolens]|uniref:Uncharacterized protein n=1 Tax=Apium graveolens TaxID=4045 RepID=A0A6L5B936_APIGR|nr:hypothetical protein AG4045_023437 [Apium graveolens]